MENGGTASQGEDAAGPKGAVFLEDGVGGGLRVGEKAGRAQKGSSQRAAFFSQRRQECTLRARGRACQQVQGTKNPLGRKHCIHTGLRLLTQRIPWPPSSTAPRTLPPVYTAKHPSYPAQGTGQSSQFLGDYYRRTRKTK